MGRGAKDRSRRINFARYAGDGFGPDNEVISNGRASRWKQSRTRGKPRYTCGILEARAVYVVYTVAILHNSINDQRVTHAVGE
jgi:hypothetical protein